MKGILLAIEIAVLLSADSCAAPGGKLLWVESYAHAPLFVASSHIGVKQLVLQTIFIAVLFALIVNIPWRRQKKDDRD